ERPSERDQLALAYRDGHTALAERLIEPEREPANEVVRTHPGQRRRQSIFADVRPTERDVPADVVVEQEHVLEYESDPRTQVAQAYARYGHAVEQDLTPLRLVEPHE